MAVERTVQGAVDEFDWCRDAWLPKGMVCMHGDIDIEMYVSKITEKSTQLYHNNSYPACGNLRDR